MYIYTEFVKPGKMHMNTVIKYTYLFDMKKANIIDMYIYKPVPHTDTLCFTFNMSIVAVLRQGLYVTWVYNIASILVEKTSWL